MVLTPCRWLVAVVLGAAVSADVRAADDPVSRMPHSAWAQIAGLRTAVHAITQDRDGYMWLGVNAGLIRFDGERFVPWSPRDGPPFPARIVRALYAANDGTLWVGFASVGGISRVKNGVVQTYSRRHGLPEGVVRTIAEDAVGTVWAGGDFGVARFRDDRWEPLDARSGLPAVVAVYGLHRDGTGNLWIASDSGVFRRNDSGRFTQVAPAGSAVRGVAEDRFGSIWITAANGAARRLSDASTASAALHQTGPEGLLLLNDGHGHFWIATQDAGLVLVPEILQHGLPHYRLISVVGLTGDRILSLYRDRDGGVWIGTNNGLDRFAVGNIKPVAIRPILPGFIGRPARVMIAGDADDIWIGTTTGLARLSGKHSRWFSRRNGLPHQTINALHRDPEGTLWIATSGGVVRYKDDRFEPLPLQRGLNLNGVRGITSAPDGSLWLCDVSGLYRWTVNRADKVGPPPDDTDRRPVAALTDSQKRIWVGFTDGEVRMFDDAKTTVLSSHAGPGESAVNAIYEDAAGRIWLATDNGISRFDRDRFIAASARNGLPRSVTTAIAEDRNGHLWARTSAGLIRFDPDDFERAASDASFRMHYRLLDSSDGLDTGVVWFGAPSSLRAPDGALWFVDGNGIAVLDPSDEVASPTLPKLERVVADEQSFAPIAGLELPERTARLEVEYTLLSFITPAKVRFRYLLEGLDREWVDAGAGRRALYTNLAPGAYTFRLAASHNGGAWKEAAWVFSVKPALTQTRGFAVLVTALCTACGWAAWRYRLRQVRRRYAYLLDERARLAREMHDTLLQGMAGAALQLHGITGLIAKSPDAARDRMERVREALEHCMRETRLSLWVLRSETLVTRSLAEAVQERGAATTVGTGIVFQLVAHGHRRRGAPRMEEHLLRIAQEAITNAVRHAKPTRICVELRCEHAFVKMTISDDGCGFDLKAAELARGQHWGLKIMRERAQEIGAALSIEALDTGTRLEVVAPWLDR